MRQLPSAPRDPSRTAYAVGCNRVAQSAHLLPMKVRPLVPITILRDGAGPRESGGCSRRRRPAFVANRLVTGVFHVIDQCSSVCWLEGTIAVLGSGRSVASTGASDLHERPQSLFRGTDRPNAQGSAMPASRRLSSDSGLGDWG